MRDHTPKPLEDFNGFWSRGDIDSCPPDHFTDFINYKFLASKGIATRDGVDEVQSTASSVLRIYPYMDSGVGDGFLALLSDNKIYHIYGTFPGPWTVFQILGAITGMLDFGFVSINGRAYISPATNNLAGISTESIYVYKGDGATVARKAAGVGPKNADGALAAANSATTGNVQAGIHVIGVVYETDTGFLTAIGPDTLATVTATGAKKIDLTNICVSPNSYVTKRHIVASKTIASANYTGTPTDYQLFVVPGGDLNDNVTTTLTINFSDAQLIADRSNLYNLYSTVPAGGGLMTYNTRLVNYCVGAAIGSAVDGINVALISNPSEPEAFDQVSGLIVIPRVGTGITNAQEYRQTLYIANFNRLFAFVDNGDVPTSWAMTAIDQGLGIGHNGILKVGLYDGGLDLDYFIALNQSGVMLFNGLFQKPELTWKIEDFWLANLGTIGVDVRIGNISGVQDPINKIIYICIPSASMVLVGDYKKGLDAKNIRWSKWTLNFTPKCIFLFDKDNKLLIGSGSGSFGIYYLHIGNTHDTTYGVGNQKIPNPTIITGLMNDDSDENFMHLGAIRYRVTGSGLLRTTVIPIDSGSATLSNITMINASPTIEPHILANIMTQRYRIQVQTTSIDEFMHLNRIVPYVKSTWTSGVT